MSVATRPTTGDTGSFIIRAMPSRRRGMHSSQLAYGQPLVWLHGGALVVALVMIIGLLFLILRFGIPTFWPAPLVQVTSYEGKSYLGEIVRSDEYRPEPSAFSALPTNLRASAEQYVAERKGLAERRLLRIDNFELTGVHHRWINDFEVKEETTPPWALLIERAGSEGRFYGLLQGFVADGKLTTQDPTAAWEEFQKHFDQVSRQVAERTRIEKHEIGRISRKRDDARLAVRAAELRYGADSSEYRDALARQQTTNEQTEAENQNLTKRAAELNKETQRHKLRLTTADGKTKDIALDEIVRAYPANQLGFFGKLGVYSSRWFEFIADDPRNANTEGGVFPAIWGTIAMTIIMTIFVVPFGVLAALYLREYAKPGPLVSTIRIAVNNLAGVPSIVFGVFGLGFFCYIIGSSIDQLFFSYNLPSPTFGTGGLMWASLTLALLTVPVVIVATEEALAAVPRSMREGSYACGASKWQTIQRIVLPRAMPGILTGTILAMARGAGEVAPLMLVGAMKIAPDLPIDSVFPYVHLQRSFMHLGFHIYDVGFQSPDSESAKPMVFTTTLLLIALIGVLNLSAMWLRNRLRRKYQVSQF
jgi:phosphate transport system permease protein